VVFNYKIENFISTPTNKDRQLKIYNKYGILKYNVNPDIAYFFYKNNNIIIKIEDKEDIILDFKSNDEAVKALSKLNNIKKQLSLNISEAKSCGYDISGITNLSLSGLTDVTLNNTTSGDTLLYINGEWVNSLFTGDVIYTNPAPTPNPVGGIPAGETFSGRTMQQMWDQLLYPTILPTYSNKYASISGVNSNRVEVGSTFSFTLVHSFNQGVIDSKDSHADIPLVGSELSYNFSGPGLTGNNVSYVAINGLMTWEVVIQHSEGTGLYYDSTGTLASNLDHLRVAGQSSAINSKRGSYYQWYGVSTTPLPTNSSEIRLLSHSWIDNDFTISIIQGQTYVAWYRPQINDTGNMKVIYVESSNADLTTEIIRTSIQVDDANGVSVNYYKYEHNIGGTGYAADATYHITF
jgi:hypothetical protein